MMFGNRLALATLSLASAAALTSACQLEDPLAAVGTDSQAIIGGNDVTSTMKYPNVVRLDLNGSICTGTLIEPNIVLSAAHCAEEFTGGRARFGTGPGNWIQDPDGGGDLSIDIEQAVIHRAFQGFAEKDVSLMRLAREAPDIIEPAIMNLDPIPSDYVGTQVTTVGFGNNIPPTGGDPSTGMGAGKMREVTYGVAGVTAEHIIVGDMTENTCQGDSGGPTFGMIGGEVRVLAVTSFGTFNCQGQSDLARTDVYQNDFLLETIAAWYGPCSQDGNCDPQNDCQFIDPDCDICGFDGFCGTDCETVDLDCPLGGLAGDTCEDKYDCESRLCITAPDDDRVKYCSSECDPGVSAAEQCDIPLSACGKNDGQDVCMFSGPTPGTQGAECTSSDECLGACDPDNGICVEQCDSNADCDGEFSCIKRGGVKVCTIAEDTGCGCRTGSAPGSLPLAASIFAGLLALLRRRRRVG